MPKKRFWIPVVAIALFAVGSSFKSDFLEISKQIEIFTTLFKELNMNYVDETNPAELMDSAIKNMLDDLDPYTRFMNEQDVESFKINNAGEYSGIGALVRSYKSKLVVVEPYKDYPADIACVMACFVIIKIVEFKIFECVDIVRELLKGANGTEVEITFVRQGETKKAMVKREGVEVDAVPFYEMVDETTGYVVLSKFNRKASSQTKAAIEDLKGKGMQKLILDLRGNPGGLLSEAVNVTNLFVPKGELIVTTKSKVKKFNQEYRTKKSPVDLEIPLVVLVDGRSASASEIVSGSLQDLDRAVVMGARSFGKGLVQRPLKLTYGTQLKVTISRYYTPSGRCIQALDYWNRDQEGNAVRNTNFKAFKTRNGRTVEDGGGVMPDVEIASLKSNDLTRALSSNQLIFDFATDYFYDHTFENPSAFTFSTQDYDGFKSYVKKQGFSFQTETEKLLEASIDSEKQLLGSDVEDQYKALLATVNQGKFKALDSFEKEIRKSLEDEIIRRYFYREGLYQYYLSHDEAIQTATTLLQDNAKYTGLLQ